MLDVSVLGKAEPERLVLEKTFSSQIIPLIYLSGEERKQQNTLGCQPGTVIEQTAAWLSPSDRNTAALAQGAGGCGASQATSIAWSLLFGGRSVLFQVLLYPQVNVQEQRHISAEANPSLPHPPKGTGEPCREEGSPCESSQERHGQQSRGSHHLTRE